jgi:hypothetical protein
MRLVVAAVVVSLASTADATPTLQSQSDPYPGIHRETWTDVDQRIRLIRVDLTSAEIALYATAEANRGETTSDYAARKSAQVAINGGPFAVNNFVPRGLAMGEGNVWSQTADDASFAVFHMRRAGERTLAAIVPPENVVTAADLPDGTEGVLSGRPLLVRQSQVTQTFDCSDPITIPCQPAPRTAIGVSPDGNTLWLVVVDGWQQSSLGMTAAQLAEFMRARGAGMAMALDGGSSSTLVVGGALASQPSDGVERAVANHLAIKYGSLPKGELYGLICKHSVINCADDTPSRKISGATVTLDDGRAITTDTTGSYDFLNITPRLACVTVRKAGYVTKTQCHQVVAGELQYNSVAMWEGTDPVDAGVDDAATTSPDATTAGDGGTSDGGFGAEGPGGGCCDSSNSGRDRPPALLVLVVALFLMRRRGTTA